MADVDLRMCMLLYVIAQRQDVTAQRGIPCVIYMLCVLTAVLLTDSSGVLFTLAKHARQTGAFKLARHALEKMQVLHTQNTLAIHT